MWLSLTRFTVDLVIVKLFGDVVECGKKLNFEKKFPKHCPKKCASKLRLVIIFGCGTRNVCLVGMSETPFEKLPLV